VLISFVLMLVLYQWLARHEEQQCLERFGEPYREYLRRTGRFFPNVGRGEPRAFGWRKAVIVSIFAFVLALSAAFALREYSLNAISAVYGKDEVVLSPAPLARDTLVEARRTAAESRAWQRLRAGQGPYFVQVIPEGWFLADLGIDPAEQHLRKGGHHTPRDFDRHRFKVLLARARTHAPGAAGKDILRGSWGREPLLVAHVDLAKGQVVAETTPPPHVLWGNIPTPLF
jgi:hypothetical protein